MRPLLLFLAALVGLSSCAPTEPWRVEMREKLDSMVVLAESHVQVAQSLEQEAVAEAAKQVGALQVFFIDHTEDMIALEVDKSMFTGPLFEMENCAKYYGRVMGSYAGDLKLEYNLEQLQNLRKDISSGALDSTVAADYFNTEAFALRDADKRVNKSYGACFACLRTHEELVTTLDSLKNYILATNVPTE